MNIKEKEEMEDLKDFANDIIALRNNYNNISPYYCEDLEFDFFTVLERWSKKIKHYKWEGDRNDRPDRAACKAASGERKHGN